MSLTRRISPIVVVLLLISGAAFAAERYGMDPATYDDWRRNHGRFARAAIADGDGGYHLCPMYDRRYPSSAGMTISGARDELTMRVKQSMYGTGPMVQTRVIKPPDAEAEALAMALPEMKVGRYGYLHSVEVVEVLGPEDMIVEDAWLIDPDRLEAQREADEERAERAGDRRAADQMLDAMYEQREALEDRQKDREFGDEFRLTGFRTAGLERGDRWLGPRDKGLQVALVDYEPYGSESRPKYRMVARPASDFGDGVSEEQFVELLRQRGIEPTEFVEMIKQEHRKTLERDEADRAVFDRIVPADPDD